MKWNVFGVPSLASVTIMSRYHHISPLNPLTAHHINTKTHSRKYFEYLTILIGQALTFKNVESLPVTLS